MSAPKKHRFIVEVTDMYHGHTISRMRDLLDRAIDYGAHHISADFENIQVKDYNRHEQALIIAERKKQEAEKGKPKDLTVIFEGQYIPPGHHTIVSTNDYLNLQAKLRSKE